MGKSERCCCLYRRLANIDKAHNNKHYDALADSTHASSVWRWNGCRLIPKRTYVIMRWMRRPAIRLPLPIDGDVTINNYSHTHALLPHIRMWPTSSESSDAHRRHDDTANVHISAPILRGRNVLGWNVVVVGQDIHPENNHEGAAHRCDRWCRWMCGCRVVLSGCECVCVCVMPSRTQFDDPHVHLSNESYLRLADSIGLECAYGSESTYMKSNRSVMMYEIIALWLVSIYWFIIVSISLEHEFNSNVGANERRKGSVLGTQFPTEMCECECYACAILFAVLA